jgi:hypothetical protein
VLGRGSLNNGVNKSDRSTWKLATSIRVPVCYLVLAVVLIADAPSQASTSKTAGPEPSGRSKIDNYLLDDISRRSFRYFWEQMDPHTGLVLDRARADGEREDNPNHQGVASIAATGFGLTALCIAADHRWISPELARERVRTTLRFFAYRAPNEHGWFYHYLDAATGERQWASEVSSIDTALLLAGILTARQAFREDKEIEQLATAIYNRVDFSWMLNGSRTVLCHGWKPETGILPYRWDTYSEQMILYVLAIASPTHPISPDAWYSWTLPIVNFEGHTYVGRGPLFTHQYSLAWVDLRGRGAPQEPPAKDFVPRVNFFANSVAATRAQQAFGIDLSHQFPGYSANVWGITASDSARGYVPWGGSLKDPRIDGTVVPSAAGGSLMFAPEICIPALRTMLVQFGKKIYGRYGFADAFNPTTGWVSQYVIGIDAGIMLLSAENLRTGNVWQWFMSNPEAERSLVLVGFAPDLSLAFQRETYELPLPGKGPTNSARKNPSNSEVPVVDDYNIPASAFQFKIKVPDYWVR